MRPVHQLIQMFVRHTGSYKVFGTRQTSSFSSSAGEREIKSERRTFGCRHIAALIGFGVFVVLNIQKVNMTVGIVAMVKHSVPSSKDSNSESCPLTQHQMKEGNLTQYYSDEVKTDGEFDWSPKLQGYILGANFAGFILTQLIAGNLSEIFGCKWMIFSAVFVSSLFTLVTPYLSWWNVYALIAAQALKGMATGVFQSSISVLASNWFPAMERGLLFGFVMSGNGVGLLAGGLITGYLCQAPFAGWAFVFFFCGAAGIIFAFFIAIFLKENPSVHPRIHERELKFILNNQERKLYRRRPKAPWRSILTSLPVYALSFAIFGQMWGIVHLRGIQPTFLGTILHFPIAQNGVLMSMPFLLQTFFALTASFISNTLQKNNYVNVDKVRKFWNFMSCLGYSACLVGIYFAKCNRIMSVAFSSLATASLGLAFAGSLIVAADMTPTFAGTVTGLASTIGSTGGFILSQIFGFLTNGKEVLEEWNKIFFISIGVVMASGISFCIFGSAEIQSWNYIEEQAPDDVEKQKTESKLERY